MSMKGIRHAAMVGVMAASVGMFSVTACGSVDVSTPDGLQEALERGERLDKAMTKVTGLLNKPEEMKRYVPALLALYEKGTAFDREVIQCLAASGDERANKAFTQALNNEHNRKDYKQVIQAAYGIKKNEDLGNLPKLIEIYDEEANPEVKRVILDVGTSLKDKEMANLAVKVLNGNLDETPFALLRTSCDVLAFQQEQDQKTVDTLMRVVYHQDGVGRTLTTNCTRALMALPKSIVAPVLLTAYKLENKDLMAYVEKHPDTLTPESIRNNTANALAIYRYEDAIEPMLDYIGNTKTIPVPGTLAIRPTEDMGWSMWAGLVGVSAQSSLFAINDIGVRDNKRAKEILTNIFKWPKEYKSKFKFAIELTGSSNIEVSQRVNAFRTLRENDLISSDEVVEMIEMLKGDEFTNERTLRPWARASIATDMITYCAVTAKAGDTEKIWKAFDAMRENEFKVNLPEGMTMETAKKDLSTLEQSQTLNFNIFTRIDDVKEAFELADKCDAGAGCYAKVIDEANDQKKDIKKEISPFVLAKIIYELGLSGDHDKYFKTVCDLYKYLDVFGQLYGTKALAQLGSKKDIPTIEKLIQTLGRDMDQLNYQVAKPNLEGLITTLNNKK